MAMVAASNMAHAGGMGGKNTTKVQAKLAELELKVKGEQDHVPWIRTPQADTIFGITILANAAFIGIDIEVGGDGFSWVKWSIESVFLVIFLIELFLRVRAERPNYWNFFDKWGIFDGSITIIGVADAWVLMVIVGTEDNPLSSLTVLRMLRLVRLVRLIRVLRMFSELVVLVQTIGNSIRAVAWMSLLLGMIMYTSSIVTVLLIGQSDKGAVNENVQSHFGSLGQAIFAHFKIVTLENWPDVAEAAMEVHWIWAVYFIGMIVLTNFALVNLMVGVIVERIIHLSIEQENELASFVAESDQFRSTLQALFDSADMDHSGEVTRAEIKALLDDPRTHEIMSAFSINLNVPKATLHTIMNLEGDGPTTFKDFFDACMRMCGSKQNIHSVFVQHDICDCQRELSKCLSKLESKWGYGPPIRSTAAAAQRAQRTGGTAMPENMEETVVELLERMDRFGQVQQQIFAEVHAMKEARNLGKYDLGGDFPDAKKDGSILADAGPVLLDKIGQEIGQCCIDSLFSHRRVAETSSRMRARSDGPTLRQQARRGLEAEWRAKRSHY